MSKQPIMDEQRADEVWRRVAPELNPYPEARHNSEAKRPPDPPFMRPKPPKEPPQAQVQAPATKEVAEPEALALAIAAERAQQRDYQLLSRRVPATLQPTVNRLAAQTGRCVRRLMSACYLITDGNCRLAQVPSPQRAQGTVAQQLGQQYRRALRSADDYKRWVSATDDPVLKDALQELSDVKHRHAHTVLRLLEDLLAVPF